MNFLKRKETLNLRDFVIGAVGLSVPIIFIFLVVCLMIWLFMQAMCIEIR